MLGKGALCIAAATPAAEWFRRVGVDVVSSAAVEAGVEKLFHAPADFGVGVGSAFADYKFVRSFSGFFHTGVIRKGIRMLQVLKR